MSNRKAFTLIELLVVIAIIALLVSIIMPSLRKAKALALRVTCTSNLHGVLTAMHTYTTDYNEKLPSTDPAVVGQWLFDVPQLAGDFLRDEYSGIDIMYCPANSRRRFDPDELEEMYEVHTTGSDTGWAVTDYFWLMQFGVDWRADYEYRPESRFEGKMMFSETLNQKNSSSKPLVADVTFTWDSVSFDHRDFSEIWGGADFPFSSCHVQGINPEGGNVAFCDGSATWYAYDEMTMNYSEGPYHYW